MRQAIAPLTLLSVASLFGQTNPAGNTNAPEAQRGLELMKSYAPVTKVITLKYPERVDIKLLEGMGLGAYKQSGSIVVVTGTPERVDVAESILKQLDVPPPPRPPAVPKKNIQLTAYLIIASPTAAAEAHLPKDLEAPVNQVAAMFPYKSFNVFDAIVMRLRESEKFNNVTGVLPRGQQTFLYGGNYRLNLSRIDLEADPAATLMHISGFELNVGVLQGQDKDGHDRFQNVALQTNLDIKEGQKVVIGKANIDGSENALIVVLTAKVVE
jgi:hypothetical protein